MKNIHIIPTDKPSRLFKVSDELKLTRKFDFYNGAIYQNIYITSDEEIKKGDWFIKGDSIHKCFRVHKTDIEFLTSIDSVYCGSNTFWSKEFCKKIILTTDQDLINDGVQVIDDEFLEWFLKNSSCEEVEVNLIQTEPLKGFIYNFEYKIIIPKEEQKELRRKLFTLIKSLEQEEPKQSYVKSETEFLGIEFTLKDGSKQFVPNLKEEPKEELNLNCFDCNKSLQDCTCMEDTIDMKQESIEEAASRLYPAEWDWKEKESFIEGAEWEAERSYSEEDMLQALNIGFTSTDETWEECVEFTKEQFKKK